MRAHRVLGAIVVPLVGQASCTRDAPVQEMPLRDAPVTARAVVAQRVETLSDTLGFHATTDLLAHPSGYLVVDGGNDRLVLLDHDLAPVEVYGSSGSGPGELEAPMTADRSGERFAVAELINGRISFFGLDGSFNHVRPLPGSVADLALEPTGAALVASSSTDAFLTRIDSTGGTAAFGRRPEGLLDGGRPPSPAARKDKVAVARDGTVLVLENSGGHLLAFHPSGRLLRTARLPSAIVDVLSARNRALRTALARQGTRVVGDGLVKAMKTQDDGNVLVLFTAPPHFGLVIDPETFEGTLLSVPESPGPWEPLLNAVGGVLKGSELTVLHAYGVTRYRLSDVPW